MEIISDLHYQVRCINSLLIARVVGWEPHHLHDLVPSFLGWIYYSSYSSVQILHKLLITEGYDLDDLQLY